MTSPLARIARCRWTWLAAVAATTLAACLPGCRSENVSKAQPQDAPAAAPLQAEVVAAQLERWPLAVRVQGSLTADEHVVIGAKVAGRVARVHVDLGDKVREGQLLVSLDAKDQELRVAQAKAQLDQAQAKLGLKPDQDEKTLDRQSVPAVREAKAVYDQAQDNLRRAESLRASVAIPEEELEQRAADKAVAEAKYGSALNAVEEQVAMIAVQRAELAVAQQILRDCEVTAPFDGVVESRHVAPGAYLQVGQPVVSLMRIDPLRFRAGVPERAAARLLEGQEVQIAVEGRSERIAAKVTRISPALETSNRALAIEADVANSAAGLRGGLFAEASIVVDREAQGLSVPASAVWEFAGVEKVWLVRDGQAIEQIVRTGRRDPDRGEPSRLEILEGLSPGDTILRDAATGRRGPVVAPPAEKPADNPETEPKQ